MTTTTEAATEVATPTGRHAGAPAAADHEADLEMERLVEAGIPSGLPAGLGDNQGVLVLGSHRADDASSAPEATTRPRPTPSHLPWRLVLTSVLAVLVVLALAFVALDGLASAWTAGGRPA